MIIELLNFILIFVNRFRIRIKLYFYKNIIKYIMSSGVEEAPVVPKSKKNRK